jgi:hypothetical protein
MKKSIDTADQVKQVVEQFAELRQGYVQVKEKYDAIVAKFREEIAELKEELDKREVELEEYEKFNIPRVFIMEIENKQLHKKYLKAVVRYYLKGERKQKATTIHLGQITDFQDGLNDPRILELANFKALEFVQRKKLSSLKNITW